MDISAITGSKGGVSGVLIKLTMGSRAPKKRTIVIDLSEDMRPYDERMRQYVKELVRRFGDDDVVTIVGFSTHACTYLEKARKGHPLFGSSIERMRFNFKGQACPASAMLDVDADEVFFLSNGVWALPPFKFTVKCPVHCIPLGEPQDTMKRLAETTNGKMSTDMDALCDATVLATNVRVNGVAVQELYEGSSVYHFEYYDSNHGTVTYIDTEPRTKAFTFDFVNNPLMEDILMSKIPTYKYDDLFR